MTPKFELGGDFCRPFPKKTIRHEYIQSILYLVFENTLPKVSFTTALTAIGMWGSTPVRATGVLVTVIGWQ